MSTPTRYLILPARGLQATANNSSTAARDFLLDLTDHTKTAALRRRMSRTIVASTAGAPAVRGGARAATPTETAFDVVDSINEDGVKLITATPESAAALRFDQPGLRIIPEVFCSPARFVERIRHRATQAAAGPAALQHVLKVKVVRSTDDAPVRGVGVVGFTDYKGKIGAQATTAANGVATLRVFGSTAYQRLYVQHELPGLWSALKKNAATDGEITLSLQPIDLSAGDSLRHFHDIGADADGRGVTVAVVDSGIDLNHTDLVVSGGLGCVPGEPETDFGPSGGIHGTHVAGIIAGRGQAPTGMRGIAPAAAIRSYRVFGTSESSGSNFAVIKAIKKAVEDGCDLINLSLTFNPDENGISQVDPGTQEAILEAHRHGTVVIAATGNDGRQPVSYPAMDDLAIAVSAVGRKGTYPSKSSEFGDEMSPVGADSDNYIAAFSNVGTAVDLCGAGVGIISTVPGGHGAMSGTSMACPAVTGVAARLLAGNPAILNMPRDANRSDAIRSLLFDRAASLALGLEYEGKGLTR